MSFINDSRKCKSAYDCGKSNRMEQHRWGGGEGWDDRRFVYKILSNLLLRKNNFYQ